MSIGTRKEAKKKKKEVKMRNYLKVRKTQYLDTVESFKEGIVQSSIYIHIKDWQ